MSLRPEHRRVMIQLLTVLIIFLLVAGVYLGFQVALATTTPWVAVASGSMRPALEAGDLVIVKGVPATDIEVGDIIIFDSPRGVRTIHRVTRIQTLHNGTIQFKTKGDANPSEELYWTPEQRVHGRVLHRIPYIGWLALDPTISIIIIITVIIIILLWPEKRRKLSH